ncbi:hypothetical protein HDE_02142 [Halotydeus destructor]|nr:hypothetical protein HDE_02142 [Halotydeus destructor]
MRHFCSIFKCFTGARLGQIVAERAKRKSQLVKIVAQYVKDVFQEDEDEWCSLGGFAGSAMPLIPKLVGFNCTVSVDDPGKLDMSGNYSGIIGSLQRGTADVTPMPVSLPLEGLPVHHGAVSFADKISFTTMYKRPRTVPGDSDLLTTFLQFDASALAAILCLFTALFAVLKFHRQRDAVFKIVQSLLQSVSPHMTNFSVRLLYWSMASGFFILTSYYSNYILTDNLRQQHPNVLRYFFDILKSEAEVYILPETPVRHTLRRSANPKVRAVADKLDAMPARNTIRGMDSTGLFSDPPTQQLFGLLSNSLSLRYSRIFGCISMQQNGDDVAKALWIPNDSPYEYLTTSVYNQKMDKEVMKVLDLANLHYFEHDLSGDNRLSRVTQVIRDHLFEGLTPDRFCYSDAILFEQPDDNQGIGIENVRYVCVAATAVYLVALLLLLWKPNSGDTLRRRHKIRQRQVASLLALTNRRHLAAKTRKSSPTSVFNLYHH